LKGQGDLDTNLRRWREEPDTMKKKKNQKNSYETKEIGWVRGHGGWNKVSFPGDWVFRS